MGVCPVGLLGSHSHRLGLGCGPHFAHRHATRALHLLPSGPPIRLVPNAQSHPIRIGRWGAESGWRCLLPRGLESSALGEEAAGWRGGCSHIVPTFVSHFGPTRIFLRFAQKWRFP